MGNDNKKGKKSNVAPPVKPIEIKTYVMSCQSKMSLYRNKKVYEIKKKKDEAIAALKQNNLDIAKAKMESIIRLEDTITVYDILGPLCEILKERITYLCEAQEVPPDIKAQLDTIIYASSRIDVDDLYQLRSLVQRKYGTYYIEAADQNKDGLVNINVIEKLKIKPPVDAFLTIRLKQLCKEKKFNYEFPEEIAPTFDQGMGNQFGGPQNPYDSQGMGMGNNPYGQGNDNNNPYAVPNNNPYSGNNMGPGPGNDFDSYMRNGGGMGGPGMSGPGGNPYNSGNNNPYSANNNGGGNPYDNNNSGGNPYGNNNTGGGNPFDNNNSGGNPYGNNNTGGGNPFDNNNSGGNPYGNNNTGGGNPFDNNNSGGNPYGNNNTGGGNPFDNSNSGGNPFAGGEMGNNPYGN